MKVIVFTEGGQSFGFGHITRCLSITQALEERGVEVNFIIRGDETVNELLEKRNCSFKEWFNFDIFLSLAEINDGIIIDSLQISSAYLDKILKLYKKTIVIDDLQRLKCKKGIVIDMMVMSERKQYSIEKGLTYLLGCKYYPLRKEFWETSSKEIKPVIDNILITFGGNDSRNMTPKVLKILNTDYVNVRKTIIVGKGYKNINEIKHNLSANTEIVVNPDVKRIKKLMSDADIAIASGGVSIYELAQIGVPTVGIILFKNQMESMEKWAETGFLNLCGWWNDDNILMTIRKNIKLLHDRRTRIEKSNAGKRNIDGKGALRVADAILSYLYKN